MVKQPVLRRNLGGVTADHEVRIAKLESSVLALRVMVAGLFIAASGGLEKLPAESRDRGRDLIADLERAAEAGDNAAAASKIAELFDLVIDEADA